MSKHNYSQYSSNKKKPNYNKHQAAEEVESVITVATTEAEPAEIKMEYKTPVEHIYVNETPEVVETPKSTKPTTGTVIGCNRLNVRVEPASNADVAAVIVRDSDVKIDAAKSNKDWFKITTAAGVEGYCMRNFIRTKA